MKICFDLDGTILKTESLPIIATLNGATEIYGLTESANKGTGDYRENLRRRISALQDIPVEEVSNLIPCIPANQHIIEFIKKHKSVCSIVTSNLDCWVNGFIHSIGCAFYTSKTTVYKSHIVSVDKILDKKAVIEKYKCHGHTTVFVGDGANDIEALNAADISIAFLSSPLSYKGLEKICDHSCYDQASLVELLEELLCHRHK